MRHHHSMTTKDLRVIMKNLKDFLQFKFGVGLVHVLQ